MKLKKIVVPNYIFQNDLGDFLFHNITLLVEADSDVTPEKFDQDIDDYSISSSEIEKMNNEAAQRFFNDKYKKILKSEYILTPREFNGIRLFLNANGSDMAKLLNLDKSSISRIINENQPIQRNTMLLIMEKMGNELETPGVTRAILDKFKKDLNTPLEELNLPASIVSEWIIRRFGELEECITNLKLQKLLYYCQGIGLGRYQCKVVAEDFFAWEHGPVIQDVYRKYKIYGSSALPVNMKADLSILEENKKAVKILNDTINTYGRFTAWVLRNKTHSETPWLETPQNEKIEMHILYQFFKETLV